MGNPAPFVPAKAKLVVGNFAAADEPRRRAAKALLDRTLALRAEVARGYYNDGQASQYWSILLEAPKTLKFATTELSERAGLGSDFFTSAVRDRRKPRLHNMLSALSSVIDAAQERLGDTSDSSEVNWSQNPLVHDEELLARLEDDLRKLILFVRAGNSLDDDQVLSELRRRQIINLLETTLNVLKSPLIEKSLLRETGTALETVGAQLAVGSASGFVGGLAVEVAKILLGLAG